eukprot:100065-Prymnesium_polylepis.1
MPAKVARGGWSEVLVEAAGAAETEVAKLAVGEATEAVAVAPAVGSVAHAEAARGWVAEACTQRTARGARVGVEKEPATAVIAVIAVAGAPWEAR